MHVAFVIDNLGSGGAQRQAVELAVRLHGQEGVRASFAIYREIEFFRVRLEEAGLVVDVLPKRGPFDPGFPRVLGDWVRERAPDVVHAFLPFPSLWSALARRRFGPGGPVWIAAERSTPSVHGPPWRAAQRWTWRNVDAVTANSRPAADYIVRAAGVPAERVHYLPNGIDLAAWDHRAAGPCPFVVEDDRTNLVLIGRLSREKNHQGLLEAVARLAPEVQRSLRLWFVGGDNGPRRQRGRVREMIERNDLGADVRLEPPTPDLPAFLARVDGLVLPSLYEGFPNVVMEAMASRLPVLASRVGDVPSILDDDRTGLLIDPDDVDSLHAGLQRWLALGPERRRAMGEAARAAVESRYRIEQLADDHLDLYRRLAGLLRSGDGAVAAGAMG